MPSRNDSGLIRESICKDINDILLHLRDFYTKFDKSIVETREVLPNFWELPADPVLQVKFMNMLSQESVENLQRRYEVVGDQVSEEVPNDIETAKAFDHAVFMVDRINGLLPKK